MRRLGEVGHPLYEHVPQRGGRADHPDYDVRYVARQAEAACGEALPMLVELQRLDLDHTAVIAAAKSLNRPL